VWWFSASITLHITHYVARRAKVIFDHQHNADERMRLNWHTARFRRFKIRTRPALHPAGLCALPSWATNIAITTRQAQRAQLPPTDRTHHSRHHHRSCSP
jgi:hypothetical protein